MVIQSDLLLSWQAISSFLPSITPSYIMFSSAGCTLQCLQVSAYVGDAELEAALKGADLVVIPAGQQQL